jgi:hypothetical protein
MSEAPGEFQRWLLHARDDGDIWRMAVISPFNAPELMLAAASGDHDAGMVLLHMRRVLRRLNKFGKPNKRAPICLLCPTVLWRHNQPDVTILITPNLDDPRQIACQFICHGCCIGLADSAELNNAVLGYYRRISPPGLRILPGLPIAGHG